MFSGKAEGSTWNPLQSLIGYGFTSRKEPLGILQKIFTMLLYNQLRRTHLCRYYYYYISVLNTYTLSEKKVVSRMLKGSSAQRSLLVLGKRVKNH